MITDWVMYKDFSLVVFLLNEHRWHILDIQVVVLIIAHHRTFVHYLTGKLLAYCPSNCLNILMHNNIFTVINIDSFISIAYIDIEKR